MPAQNRSFLRLIPGLIIYLVAGAVVAVILWYDRVGATAAPVQSASQSIQAEEASATSQGSISR